MNPNRSTSHPLTDEATMLVLTRKTGQEIVIDGDIRITVTSCGDGRVKLGITAPAHIKVDRAEIAARIAAEEADCVVELACR
jgi:carbon storage regulator